MAPASTPKRSRKPASPCGGRASRLPARSASCTIGTFGCLIDSLGPANDLEPWAAGSADNFGEPVAFEFHISKMARLHYEFDRALFQTSGNVILPDFPAARAFAKRMNDLADRERYPDRVVHAAELNAMGLIDEILHHAVEILSLIHISEPTRLG